MKRSTSLTFRKDNGEGALSQVLTSYPMSSKTCQVWYHFTVCTVCMFTWRKALSCVLLLSKNFWSMDLKGSLLRDGNCSFFNDGKHWRRQTSRGSTVVPTEMRNITHKLKDFALHFNMASFFPDNTVLCINKYTEYLLQYFRHFSRSHWHQI